MCHPTKVSGALARDNNADGDIDYLIVTDPWGLRRARRGEPAMELSPRQQSLRSCESTWCRLQNGWNWRPRRLLLERTHFEEAHA